MRVMILMLLVAGAAMCGSAAPASAQTAPAQLDPARVAAVRQLYKVIEIEKQVVQAMGPAMDATMKQVTDQLLSSMPAVAQARSKDPHFDERMRRMTAVLSREVRGAMQEAMPAYLEALVPVYASIYSPEEVQAQIAFYSTPLGRSILRKTPEVAERSAGATGLLMKALGERMPAIMKKATEAVQSPDLPMPSAAK